MRRSSSPCSFFAAWYSKFSEMSPNSRARLIASTTSLRRGPSSSASSASSAARCVRREMLGSLLVHEPKASPRPRARSAACGLRSPRPTCDAGKGGHGGDRPGALRRCRRTCRRRQGGPAADRRRGHHVRLLPVPLGHRPDHGQGRPGAALGDDRAEGLPARLRRRPRTSSRTATATTSGTAPRPGSSSAIPEPETFEVLPWDPRVARVWCTCFRNREDRDGPRRGPHLRLPREPPADPGGVRGARPGCTSARGWSPR